MADRTGSLSCPICTLAYTASTDPEDRRPIIFCKNGHTLCSTCADMFNTCPTCRGLKALVPNGALLDIVEANVRQLTLSDTGIPEISADHVKLAARPFANGSYADLYDAVWRNQSVALKVLRRHTVTASTLEDVMREARLAMSLNHPNVVRVFGVVSVDDGKGLLMEKADGGSLRNALEAPKKLSFDLQISISIDIIDGLDFMHSKQMIHRDLKPENVLLFDIKPQMTAKIADFGISRVVQSSLAGTFMIGTPYYMAPELFEAQVRYGSKVDVYSVAIMLYEVFSGRHIRDGYGRFDNLMQLFSYVVSGQRPELPRSLPTKLRTVIERGWSTNANVRPTLAAFREVLCKLKTSSNASPAASADLYAVFESQLKKLEQSTNAYKLNDARSQVEACRCLWTDFRDRTAATASTALFHSLRGFVYHWFGECAEAYAATYQALAELRELCLVGTSIEGEQLVTILRYAVQVCWSQDQYSAAVLLLRYAVRYAKLNLTAAAYADVLECFGYFLNYFYLERFGYYGFYGENWRKITEFVLSTRLKESAGKPHVNVAIAHYYLALELYREQLDSDEDYSVALVHLNNALRVINQVDPENIGAAIFKSLKGEIVRQNVGDHNHLEEAKQHHMDALKLAERILGKNNEVVATVCLRLVFTLDDMERFEDAERAYKRAIKAAENSLGPNSWLVLDALDDLADMYIQSNRYQEAEALYLRSIDICKSVHGPGSHQLSHLYDCLAKTYSTRRQVEKAATCSRLKSEVIGGKGAEKIESTRKALIELVEEVSETLQCGSEVCEAPDKLADVLYTFFKVAPKPKPQSKPQSQSL